MRPRIVILTALGVVVAVVAASACGAFSGSSTPDEPIEAGANGDGDASGGSSSSDGSVGPFAGDSGGATDGAAIADGGSDAEMPSPFCIDAGISSGVLFVTSAKYYPGDNFGSVADGDALCASAADASALSGRHWKVWLSDKNAGAYDHISGAAMATYVRPDCMLVGALGAFHTTGTHLPNAPAVDEKGDTLDAVGVWTGTNAAGNEDNGATCGSWTSNNQSASGLLGGCSETGDGWTNYKNGTTDTCNKPYALYCFEQTH